jgi:hypothetical protein
LNDIDDPSVELGRPWALLIAGYNTGCRDSNAPSVSTDLLAGKPASFGARALSAKTRGSGAMSSNMILPSLCSNFGMGVPRLPLVCTLGGRDFSLLSLFRASNIVVFVLSERPRLPAQATRQSGFFI